MFWKHQNHYISSIIFIISITSLIAMTKICSGNQEVPLKNPVLFQPGPFYACIFEQYKYLFIADYQVSDDNIKVIDLMLNPNNFLIVKDPNDPNDPVVKYWTDLGADPNLFGQPDPHISDLFEREFTIYLDLPIFKDPNLRAGGSKAESIINQGTLDWNVWIAEYGANGVQALLLQPLPIQPYDGMPTYLPAYYAALDAIAALGKPYYQPELVFLLEGALWNAGMTVWPNIAALYYTPQLYEDLTVDIKVTNGIQTDSITFTLNVIDHHPVENYLPVYQKDNDKIIFFVGESNRYNVNLIDPDCFIFSVYPFSYTDPPENHFPGPPLSEDFRKDMDHLTWNMTINDMTVNQDQNISLSEGLIDPKTGLINWIPDFEAIYDVTVSCSDNKGDPVNSEFKIICISRTDTDEDSIYDYLDNCPSLSNTDQADKDHDGIGDLCDNCPEFENPNQLDTDNDETGDVCDSDDDNDGLPDEFEEEKSMTDPLLRDSDNNNVPDSLEDSDGDGYTNLQEYEEGTDPLDKLSYPLLQINMDIESGWNMISLPVLPEDCLLSDVFPGAVVVYGYKKKMGYVRILGNEKLQFGKGYWILLDNTKTFAVTGKPIYNHNFSINENGWFMIGGCSSAVRAQSINCDIAVIYSYIPGSGYKRIIETEDLDPGKGYWVLINKVEDQAEVILQTQDFDL